MGTEATGANLFPLPACGERVRVRGRNRPQREQMLDYLAATYPERRAPGGWKNPFEGK